MLISDWSSDVCSSDLVLRANSPRAGAVVARFVGDDHTGFECNGVRRLGHPLRTFVNAQIAADAVTGAVVEVQARRPEMDARQYVELGAGGAFRKTYRRECDMSLQEPGECAPLLVRRVADGDGPGNVRRHVEKLRPGVDQIQRTWFERAVRSEEHTSELQSLMRNSSAVF